MAHSLSQFAARLAQVERRLDRASRTAQLAYSSIENGAIEVHDDAGQLTGIIGVQPDGTTGVNIVNGPPPPRPTAPLVTSVLGGIGVRWDGTWADALAAPLDIARVEIHTAPTSSFVPGRGTLRTTMESPQGGTTVISTRASTPLFVRLVARTTSGAAGEPSNVVGPVGPALVAGSDLAAASVTTGKLAAGAVETAHISIGAITPEQLAVGQGTNLVPDPSFEGAATAKRIAAAGAPWSFAPGARTGVGVRADCDSEVPAYLTLPLATVPMLPSAQLWLAVDILVSADLAAAGIKIHARWQGVADEVLGYGVVESTAPVAGRWQRITGQVTAPQGTVRAVICLEASAATRGQVVFDNAEAVPTFGRATGGSRAEVGPQGLRLYDETGGESVSLVTGAPQYLTLRSQGVPVATIDTAGHAAFGDVSVAGTLSVGGDPLTELLADHARGLVAVQHISSSRTAGTTEMGFVELAFECDPTRMYRIGLTCLANPDVTGGELRVKVRDGGTASPTISSPQLYEHRHSLALSGYQTLHMEMVRAGRDIGAGTRRLLITFLTTTGTVDLFGQASRLGTFYVEDIGRQLPQTGGYNDGGGTTAPPKRTYTKTYSASWSASYAKRAGHNAYFGPKAVQGYVDATSGIHAALIGFPAALSTDLAGAVIERAEVYLYFDHWHSAGGGRAVIKAHAHATRPARFTADAEAMMITWGRNAGKWVDVTKVFDSVRWRGIALDPDSADRAFYGVARGVGETYSPRLRVTYVK
ncbi:hypothetical protein ACFVIM_00510 [Streptomyces sp. NPDC057638]|uniref:hypothetical protein n=1 Tax=Streptomyces sp. NPDC057638 TaxID=3346190 RepID=UPI0036CE4555